MYIYICIYIYIYVCVLCFVFCVLGCLLIGFNVMCVYMILLFLWVWFCSCLCMSIYTYVCSSVLIWGWGRMVVGMCLFGAGADIEMMSLGPKPLEIVFSDRHFRHQYCFHFGIKLLGACCASDHMYECVWILISFDVLFCCFVSFGFAAVLPSSCTSI